MTQTVELEPQTYRVRRLERMTRGKLDYRIKLGDYRKVDRVDVPYRLFFESTQQKVSVDMTVLDVTINPEIPLPRPYLGRSEGAL